MAPLLFGCAVIIAVVAFVIAAYRRRWAWTGFVAGPEPGAPGGQTSKSLWDWLQLLIVPLALALAAFAFNAAQDRRDRQREDERAARERASAEDRTREDALRGYLQQMSALITDHRLRVDSVPFAKDPTDAQALARTSTLTVLRRLDGERKGLVVRFLFEAGLITVTRDWQSIRLPRCRRLRHHVYWRPKPGALVLPKVDLRGADLRGVVLHGQFWSSYDFVCRRCPPQIDAADFSGTDLRNADLRRVDAHGVNFDGADLRGARLSGAHLAAATFDDACLTGARFDHAEFSDAADWPNAPGPAYFGAAQGRHVDFRHASLDRVDLRDATLSDIDLRGASQKGTMFPDSWTRTGVRMDDRRAAALCDNVGLDWG